MSSSFFETLKEALFGGTAPKGGETEANDSLLHVGWQQREESFYPSLFGPAEGPPVCLTEDMFKQDFGRNMVHPFWLHHGVITFPPTDARPTWLYATSGMSNAFDSEIDEWSGLGVEFILEVPEQADWAADKLARLMVFNLLIAAGHYRDQSDLTYGSIVRLGVPINGEGTCMLTNFIALPPTGAARDFSLVTGKVELLQMVAVTDTEADFAEKEGYKILAEKLSEAGKSSAVIVDRKSVI